MPDMSIYPTVESSTFCTIVEFDICVFVLLNGSVDTDVTRIYLFT